MMQPPVRFTLNQVTDGKVAAPACCRLQYLLQSGQEVGKHTDSVQCGGLPELELIRFSTA